MARSISEEKFRDWLETSVREWGTIDSQHMFGAQVYLVRGKMFVALGGMGLLVKLPSDVRAPLLAEGRAEAFTVTSGASFGEWVALVPDRWEADREGLLGLVRQSFDYVRAAAPPPPPRAPRRFRKRQF